MEGAFKNVWPNGVPTTLWNFDLLRPEQRPLLPFMGIRLEWGFILAFVFGVCVIAFFARQRFRQRTFDPSSFDYRVLRELAPPQLRGPGPMRRAYAYYAGTLIAAYFAMTFFGGLILRAVGSIPMAGLQVEVDNAALRSEQWPLTLALALAGFAPLIRPLEIVETWLRQKAHQWVGIPVKIRDNTRSLLAKLESMVSARVSAEAARLPAWAERHIEATDLVRRVMVIHEELELLLKLIRDEKAWPAGSVREDLKRLEVEVIAEAEVALQDFSEILETDYDKAGHAREREKTEREDVSLGKHQRRLETKLTATIQQMERLRDEFAAIFTIYAERDKAYQNIRDRDFSAVMQRTFPDEKAPPGPDVGVLMLLFPVFLIYAAVTAAGLHSLLTAVDRTVLTVLVTAGLETLRIAAIFWLPLLAVFFWRHYLQSKDDWQPIRLARMSGQLMRRVLAVVVLAAFVALVGLSLLTLLWMAVIAENPAHFRELLFGGKQPAIAYFLSQAGAAAFFTLVVVCAADSVAANARNREVPTLLFGVISAVLVLAWMAAHLAYWSPVACSEDTVFLLDLVTSPAGCFRHYNATDLIVYVVIALLAAGVFVRPARSGGKDETVPTPSVVPGLTASGLAVIALMMVFGSSAFAQPVDAQAPEGRKVIVAGFRTDAEPFSYRLGVNGDGQFKGYMAQLCYKIFEGSDYTVVSVPVDARDRFDRLRISKDDRPYDPNLADDDQKVDIFCDPVTLRFSDPDTRANGIFSPIVFASGVTYLLRRTRQTGSDAYLAYVADTTASVVARWACQIDLFGVRRDGGKDQDCNAPAKKTLDCPGPDGTPPEGVEPGSGPKYRFCVMESHSELMKTFCRKSQSPLGYQFAYFGDREIVLSKLAAWTQQHGCPTSEIEKEHPYVTYEPYALLISKADPDLVQFVQRRVFEFFSHRSEALSLFTTYFPDMRMSPAVANLFLLNAVAEEKYFRFSPPEAEDATSPATGITANVE
ncbi:hypothetical protein MesoLjLc_38010 [Mesorhizobium sp. L-8-10]|uniref:hypothetical protein n=1 Tax=unclassified Mesorhizobium TaxID=325217 RepID=UPI0019293151|nr:MULTISPECIES: hypothetical protein [unclassified Mesorhizobium]BCH24137.1 hypothetical protein MesoLjLb_39220 [Mesorhizobium sp. L-8-3]BCH31871.1 hypothetical protein MesoLjLc_38010 [Mesorhizobium sp. L-8-10]